MRGLYIPLLGNTCLQDIGSKCLLHSVGAKYSDVDRCFRYGGEWGKRDLQGCEEVLETSLAQVRLGVGSDAATIKDAKAKGPTQTNSMLIGVVTRKSEMEYWAKTKHVRSTIE